jgi:hypothetical protein
MNRNEQEIQRRLAIRMGVIGRREADAHEELARKIVDAIEEILDRTCPLCGRDHPFPCPY